MKLTGIAQTDECVCVSADQRVFFGPLDPFEDMVHVVETGHCRHGPLQLRQNEQLPVL